MFVFSEDPPLKLKGHGLSVLLHNLFVNSGIEIRRWYTFLPKKGISVSDIQTSGAQNIKVIGAASFFSFFRRWGRVNEFYNNLLFFLYFPRLMSTVRSEPARPIFIPIGASAFILFKIRMIESFTPNPVWIYQVDDVAEIARRQHNRFQQWLCHVFLKKAISDAQYCFAISEGLAAVMTGLSKKPVDVILPCFQKIDPIRRESGKEVNNKPFTFVFTGGLSFLYNDALRIFADYMGRYAKESLQPCRMIVQTYSPKEQFEQVNFNGQAVEYRTAADRNDLYKTYEEADAFLVPYSFDPALRPMVSTSFPQKVAQIIQFGLPLIIFGPEYGSVALFFEKHSLPYLVNNSSYEKFEETLSQLIGDRTTTSFERRYYEMYEANFSQEACLEKLKTRLR